MSFLVSFLFYSIPNHPVVAFPYDIQYMVYQTTRILASEFVIDCVLGINPL
jgi:hypothetical protein